MKTRKGFGPAAFAGRYKTQIEACGRRLATDFDAPAQSTINRMFADIGVERFAGGDDRWEQVQAHLGGYEYERPPARLLAGWAGY